MSAASVTSADKLCFLNWAQDDCSLTRSEQRVLLFVVENIIGLKKGLPPGVGRTDSVTIARKLALSRRGVQYALGGLRKLGLLSSQSIHGVGGGVRIEMPLLVGAAKSLPKVRLRRVEEPGDAVENVQCAARLTVENVQKRVSKTCSPLHPNPSYESSFKDCPTDRAGGGAAEPVSESNLSDLDGGEGLLTQARARLLARLRGLAGKGGIEVGATALAEIGEETVQRWLRWQRDGHNTRLVTAMTQWLAEQATDPVEFGRAVAGKSEAKTPDERQGFDPPPAPPPSPAAPYVVPDGPDEAMAGMGYRRPKADRRRDIRTDWRDDPVACLDRDRQAFLDGLQGVYTSGAPA